MKGYIDHAIKLMKKIDISKEISAEYKIIFKKMIYEESVIIYEIFKNEEKIN